MKKIYTLLTTLLLISLYNNLQAQAPGCTTNIFPSNMATDVNPYPYVTLKWNPVPGAASYDIYYSSKIPPRQLAGNSVADTFNFTIADYSTSYYWYVVPKNADGTAIGCVSSATAFVTMNPPPPPANDNCSGAISIGNSAITGSTLGATESMPAASCSGYTGKADDDVWYDFTPLTTGVKLITLTGDSRFDGILEIFTGSCGSLTALNCSDTSQLGGTEQIILNATAGTSYKIRVYSFDADLASRGTFTIAAADQVLPVSLTSFKGERRNNTNVLSWTTATELNNKGFEVQYSTDGNNFEKLAFVNSKSADGNSSLALSYEYVDASASNGNAYYRLKQVDKNGQAVFSNIIYLKGDKVSTLLFGRLYPNPATSKLNVVISSPSNSRIVLEVRDLAGKVIRQAQESVVAGDNKLSLDVSALPAGSYFLKAMNTEKTQTTTGKFVKQ